MGCSTSGTTVPGCLHSWVTVTRMILLGCFMFLLSDATKSLNFPGSFSCQDNEIVLRKPKGIRLSSWQTLHVLDSAGDQLLDCDAIVNGKTLTIPDRCTKQEVGRRVLHMALNSSAEKAVPTYRVVCNDIQSDDFMVGTVVNCTEDLMSVKISRTLSGFDDEVVSAPVPSAWTIIINDHTKTLKLNVHQARQMGYLLTSDASDLVIQAYYNASGIRLLTIDKQKFYSGDIQLSSRLPFNIVVDAPMNCYKGPPACNATHMTILIPAFGSALTAITMNNVDIPLNTYALQRNGITLDTNNGVRLYINKNFMKTDVKSGRVEYSVSLMLTFNNELGAITMLITPTCPPEQDSPLNTVCSQDGYMNIEVVAAATKPNLNLDTVKLGDGRCQPTMKSESTLIFHVPLNACGTTVKLVGNQVLYENEIHALWKDSPPARISRDSEYRLTIQCYYAYIADATVMVDVVTYPPLASSKTDGPLSLILNLFPDNSYSYSYSSSQYPVVKTLRDPIYLEVQLLNRNDPNIELVLDDCWATMSQDPNSLPQWNIVVDGCQATQDNYLTVFHPVSGVTLPSYRKRFEVKTFAFVLSDETSTNLIYFYCSAVVCNTLAPDSPLCSKSCPMSKKRRSARSVHPDTSLVSLPGPILFVDSETFLKNEDRSSDLVEHLAIGVLPILGVTVVFVLIAVLVVFKCKVKPDTLSTL